MRSKEEKLTWGNTYRKDSCSIRNNELSLRIDDAYNEWDDTNEHNWNNLYSWESEEERYKKYLHNIRKSN
ncbi:hypothetical protein M3649_04070 [Ureibacillus chungkukjangi]|uniref:hypothetical protein n=1 Tax=Ureibacillus chungkukjangi TaxID=1202712 RepID=UPI0020413BF7|nr:hypothetical protein [Ureibacillus chungkukjangi]MCM3387309.1 hypothetical protein [Ureibacillus chungkukjangi]